MAPWWGHSGKGPSFCGGEEIAATGPWKRRGLRVGWHGKVETPKQVARAKAKKKVKYTHVCDDETFNLWGKPGVEIFCGCGDEYEEVC